MDSKKAQKKNRYRQFARNFKKFWNRHIGIIFFTILFLLFLGVGFGSIGIYGHIHKDDMKDLGRIKLYTTYRVRYGDTLWDISKNMVAVNPEYPNINVYLKEVRDINNIHGDKMIISGDVIVLPYFIFDDEDIENANRYMSVKLKKRDGTYEYNGN